MNERQRLINEYIQERNEVSLASLKELVPDVSEMTIRRDLEALELKGSIVRVHGGARSVNAIKMLVEDAFSKRLEKNIDNKRAIAKKALAFVEDNSSVYIDAGSTMLSLVEMIPDKKLLITTCGINIAAALLQNKKSRVNIIGGEVNKDSISTYGPGALASIENVNIDVAFIASTAFSENCGFSCGNAYDAELKREVLSRATLKIMMMDSSKVSSVMPYTFARPENIDILISDGELSSEIKMFFEEKGINVL